MICLFCTEVQDARKSHGNSETDNGNATDVSGGDQDVPEKTSNPSSGAESFATKDEHPKVKREGSKDRSQRED